MDLLAGYSDEGDSGKNTPTQSDKNAEILPVLEAVTADTALEAEWESFEKMIGESGSAEPIGPPPLPVAAPQMPDLSQSVVQSEPPNLTTYENSPSIVNHVDPPVLANMTEPPKLIDIPSTSSVPSDEIKTTPPKLTDVTLSSEFNSDVVFEEHESEMPTLTKMTASPSSSPDNSSSRSSSSGSRSSSVESVKSEEKKSSPSHRKSPSPSRAVVGHSHKKDEKRSKRSRSRSHSRSRSRDKKKRRSSDKKRSRSRDRKRSDRRRRSRSRGKRRHQSSHSRSKRRSRSRSRHRSTRERKSSREGHKRKEERSHRRERKHRSRDRSREKSRERHRRSHSRERRRSRSGSPIRGRERFTRPAGKGDKKPLTFKEQMRQQLLKASKMLSEQGEGSGEAELPKEKPSNLPLNANSIYTAASTQAGVTPQMALLQTMAAMHQKAQEMTGVAVPKYYNPAAVNPLKYAEQVQKRKLLWSKNKEKKEEESQWQSTAFVQDDNGKMAAKFRKLMGMKEDGTEGVPGGGEESEEQKKKTEEMFYRLDKEYEFARMTTHTHRGIGLGFQSQGFPNP